ncbi:MAG: beta-ketoacyl synthase N-terminal-like domain-containing protein, partial [Patescibacteria group bacterium]
IVVGTDSLLDPIYILSFQVLGALTTTEHTDPGEASRPLDEKADGFVMSEASTAFVMARRSFAERIGARILGTLSGFGCSSDAFHDTAPDPSASGVIQSMSQALEMSGKIIIKEDNFEVSPEKFKDLVISTHTTSTGDADAIEVDGIKRVLGEVTPSTPIVGLKDRLGHGLGASGSVEIAACLLMMQQNCIPGMPNLKNPRRLLSDFDFVTSSRKGVKVDSILKNSVAFGGGCYSVCIEKEKE